MSNKEPREIPVPRVLCEVHELKEEAGPDSGSTIAWRLEEPARQLDANLVRIAPGEYIEQHTEPDLDVLVLIVAGEGALSGGDGTQSIRSGALVWLPHGVERGLAAGPHGLSYVTVHTRRPGMSIRSRRPD